MRSRFTIPSSLDCSTFVTQGIVGCLAPVREPSSPADHWASEAANGELLPGIPIMSGIAGRVRLVSSKGNNAQSNHFHADSYARRVGGLRAVETGRDH